MNLKCICELNECVNVNERDNFFCYGEDEKFFLSSISNVIALESSFEFSFTQSEMLFFCDIAHIRHNVEMNVKNLFDFGQR